VTVRSILRRRRWGLSVLVASALVVLTGCGSLQPGVAAVVGSATISHDEVDRVASALCSANLGGAAARGEQAPELASRGARTGALQVLLDSELSRLFGEARGVEPDNKKLSAALAQNEPGIAVLPEDQRGDFRAALKDYAAGQLMLIEIGSRALAEQGQENAGDDVALSEGQRLRSEFVATIDVKLDPRYGTFTDETLQPGGSELSVPTSEGARAATQQEPPPQWVQTLPASQRCS